MRSGALVVLKPAESGCQKDADSIRRHSLAAIFLADHRDNIPTRGVISTGVRIHKGLLARYGFFDPLLLEETEQGLLLRKKNDNKLSWKQTYKAMADEPEDWSDLDEIVMDGLGEEDIAD